MRSVVSLMFADASASGLPLKRGNGTPTSSVTSSFTVSVTDSGGTAPRSIGQKDRPIGVSLGDPGSCGCERQILHEGTAKIIRGLVEFCDAEYDRRYAKFRLTLYRSK
jgi:hypothetical protein